VNASKPPLLEARDLFYRYPDGARGLDGVSVALAEGERLALIGANGSGKSTLLLLLSGCFKPEKGEILLNGAPVSGLQPLRDAAGLVFQEPDDQLFMPSVLEDVAFGLSAKKIDAETARARALACLDALGAAHLAERPPHRMSGGEKRIAALAGILVMRPDVILLDEPTSSLDPRARREITELLRGLGAPMIISTHDLSLARRVCGRAVILQKGQVCADGAPDALLDDEKFLRDHGL
jgi:cobalt/nickel transport system ATP-binding protein